MRGILLVCAFLLVFGPWIWAFTAGRATVNEAQGSGSAAFYLNVITVPLAVVCLVFALRPSRKP